MNAKHHKQKVIAQTLLMRPLTTYVSSITPITSDSLSDVPTFQDWRTIIPQGIPRKEQFFLQKSTEQHITFDMTYPAKGWGTDVLYLGGQDRYG